MHNDLILYAPIRECNLFIMGKVRGRQGKEKYFKKIPCLNRNREIGGKKQIIATMGGVSLFPSPLSKIGNTFISHPRSDLELIPSFQARFQEDFY